MSSIDDRIVQMKFDNAGFEKGVSTTLSSLESLKKGLALEGVKNGLDGLDKQINGISLSSLAASVDNVAGRFSGLQAIAFGALAAIGAKAVSIGQTLLTSLGDNMTAAARDGFSDYNTKLTSVQTVMNATGKNIQEVNGYFDQLDVYADKTVFNLTDMTNSLSKFTNAGISLDKAVPAIKGIANMTALAGQGANEAQIAMYNLSQSLAGGFLTTTDYKSLNLANVATSEWKNNMIAAAVAAGTLQDAGGGMYNIMADGSGKATSAAGLFNDELARGWATSDVLLGVLQQYGDETTAIGKKALSAAQDVRSLPMMLETLGAAAGTTWTQTFEIILGDVPNATKLFTFLTTEIQSFMDASNGARNAQLQVWADMGGRTALVEALQNAFKALHSVLDPIGRAWEKVFPPQLGKILAEISFGIRDFTRGLILSESAQKTLEQVATVLFSVLKVGVTIITSLFRVVGNGVRIVWELGSALLGLLAPVAKFIASLFPMGKGAGDATDNIKGMADVLIMIQNFLTGPLISALKKGKDGFDNFLNSGAAQAGVLAMISNLEKLIATIKMVWNVLAKGDFTGGGFFTEDSAFVGVLFKIRDAFINIGKNIGGFFKGVGDAAKNIFMAIKGGMTDAFTGIDWSVILAAINTGLLGAIIISITKFIKNLSGLFQGADLLGGLAGALDGLTGVFEGMQKRLKADVLVRIATAIILLAGALLILSMIDPSKLGDSLVALGLATTVLVAAMTALDKLVQSKGILKMPIIGAALIQFSVALNLVAIAIRNLAGLSWDELTRGLVGVGVAMALLVGAATALDQLKGDILKTAFAMLIMSVAINALAGAVAIFGNMPFNVLLQGLISLGIVLGGLVGAAVLMSKFAPDMVLSAVGMMAMAAAINMLVGAVILMGLIPFPILLQGFTSIGIILLLLAGTATVMSSMSGNILTAAVAMMAMAVAINLLVAPIVLLGTLPFGNVIQGLIGVAAALAIMVIAAIAVEGVTAAIPGMIALAVAVGIVSLSVMMLGSIPFGNLIQGLIGLAAVFALMGIAGLALAPLTPVLLALSGAMVLFGLGIMALAAGALIAVVAFSLMGPALVAVTGGLLVFAKAAGTIAGAVPAMLAIGAGMIVFGAGAAIAGVGILILGAGLIVLGAGFALIGATAVIGATALAAALVILLKFVDQIGNIALLGAGLLALGAGILVVGIGMALAGIGMLSFGLGLAIVAAAGLAAIPVLQALFNMAINMIPPLVAALGAAIIQFLGIMATAGPAFIQVATTLFLSILTAIQNVAPQIGATLLVLLQTLLDTIVGAVSMFVDAGMRLLTGILDGIANNIGKVIDSATNVIVNFIRGIGDNVGKVIDEGAKTIVKFVQGLADGVRNNSAAMGRAGGDLARAIIEGMANGIWNGVDSLVSAAKSVAERALNAAKNFLGIHSPSREFFKVGSFSTEGWALGMSKTADVVSNSAERIGGAALNVVKKSIGNIANEVSSEMELRPSIRPILDLTDVKKNAGQIGNLVKAPTLALDNTYAAAAATQVALNDTFDNRGPDNGSGGGDTNVTFIQNNSSPKALSPAEIYRNTNNQISVAKDKLAKNAKQS